MSANPSGNSPQIPILNSYTFLASARYLADRIIVLKNGSIVEENSSEELIQNPKEEYTKQLVKAASPGWLSSLGKNFEKKEENNDQ